MFKFIFKNRSISLAAQPHCRENKNLNYIAYSIMGTFVSEHLSIYLDESGDLGFSFDNKNSSKYFVITLLACFDRKTQDVFKTATRKTLKNKINPKKSKLQPNELKASQTFHHVKRYFYKHIANHNTWQIYSIILDKTDFYKKLHEKPSAKNLYNSLTKQILEKVKFSPNLLHVELVVDKCKSNHEITVFNEYISTHLASYLPLQTKLSIYHIDSFKNATLQAADLFAWGIFRKYEHNDLGWYNVYCHRIAAEEQV